PGDRSLRRSRRRKSLSRARPEGLECRRDHRVLDFRLADAAASYLGARRMSDGADHREMPRHGEIAAVRARRLAALDQGHEEAHDGLVTALQLTGRAASRVDRQEGVKVAELLPGGSEHAVERFLQLALRRLG